MSTSIRTVARWQPIQSLEPRLVLAADLVVDLVEAPASLDVGASVEISWIVRNAGDAASWGIDGWEDAVYLSTDEVISPDDLWLGGSWSNLGGDPLAPGQTYRGSAVVQVPFSGGTTSGAYRLIVVADESQWEVEGDETNNALASAGAVSLSVPALPDLRASELVVSGSGVYGQTIELTWTVTNDGPGATWAAWSDAVYLSSDGVLDAGDSWLEVIELAGPASPLVAGESATMRATVRLPYDPRGQAGSFHLIVNTNEYGAQPESDGQNNVTASGAFSVVVPAPPDLVVDAVASVTSASLGDVVTITWTIRNAGQGEALWWGDEVYLSADDVLDASDLLLSAHESVVGTGGAALAPGQSITLQGEFRLAGSGLGAGQYRLLVRTDAWDSLAESDETNNLGVSQPIDVGTPEPADLIVDSGQAPAEARLGQVIEVSWSVRNQGAGNASTWGWGDGVYLSTDAGLSADDVQVAWWGADWFGAAGVAPGTALDALASIWLPNDATLEPGVYHIIIAADVDGQVFDSDRTNNTLAIATIEISASTGGPEGGPGGLPLYSFMGEARNLAGNTADTPSAPSATDTVETSSANTGLSAISGASSLAGAVDVFILGKPVSAQRAGSAAGSQGSAVVLRVAGEAPQLVRASHVG